MGHSSPCVPAYRSLLLVAEEGRLRRGQGMDDDGRDGQEGHLQSKFVDMGRADAGIMADIARRDGEGENADNPGGRQAKSWGENADNLGLAGRGGVGRSHGVHLWTPSLHTYRVVVD